MNSSNVSLDPIALEQSLRESIAAGRSRESLIQEMRAAGLNQIACIKLLRDVSGISLGDAKEAVHFSQAWSDRRETSDKLHDASFVAAKELGFQEIPS